MSAELALVPEPKAVGYARRWVRQELLDRARPELVDAAVLGVSELVTNAVMHVRGEIRVQIVDKPGPLRVEVYDDSPASPKGPLDDRSESLEPATVGRGLGIVASVSQSWGVDTLERGKRVWFQPAGSAVDASSPDLSNTTSPRPAADGADAMVTIDLIDIPVHLVAAYSVRFSDLRREMTLIAMTSPEGDSVPQRLHTIAEHVDRYRQFGTPAQEGLADALAAGLDRTSTRFTLPREAIPSVVELRDLMQEADAYCRDQELLALAVGPQARELRNWVYDEIIRQASGIPVAQRPRP
ncbi:MAG: ATP-binding protein, partial [Nocardioidaceae bacterium]